MTEDGKKHGIDEMDTLGSIMLSFFSKYTFNGKQILLS